jgi:hypothetical protein
MHFNRFQGAISHRAFRIAAVVIKGFLAMSPVRSSLVFAIAFIDLAG